jgi:hypothetical protein
MWIATAAFLALGLGVGSPAAAGPGPSLSFRETYGDVVVQRQVTQRGQFRIDAVLPLNGIDLSAIDGTTFVYVNLGSLHDASTLSQDPTYRRGRRRATIVDGGLRIVLRWNRSRVLIRVTARTANAFPPSLLARDFLGQPVGPVGGDTLALIYFGDANERFDLAYSGSVSVRNGRQTVRLNGTGTPAP